ncbi:MAG: hypothetical protein A2X23_06550 [Chloroflexi bacterium GWC2_73_18]|nr:MAG: hypothetical protein A2X23_06550 [Chloroflexi bacterium GWC2_73_18]
MVAVGKLRFRRRWLVVAVVVVLVVAWVRALDRAMPIEYYRVVDAQTVVVGSLTGAGAWTRLTSVVETPAAVTVTVSSLQAPLPGAGAANLLELVVKLHDPLGSRPVIDGSDGENVPRTRCLPPWYLAPGCR